MKFVCPDCGYEAKEAGDCPECGAPLLRDEEEVGGGEPGKDAEEWEDFDDDDDDDDGGDWE